MVRACNQLGQFLQHRETNLRYLALESMCTLASSEFSHEAVKTHINTVINALKVSQLCEKLMRFKMSQENLQPVISFSGYHGWSSCCSYVKPHFYYSCLFRIQTERDVSVRQRAVDLLYAMCDRSNAKQIVAEMLSYLETADYSIREEIVGH